MDKNNRPKGMSQLDWLWQNLGDYTISNNPADDNETILTSEAVNYLIREATKKSIVNLAFRNDPTNDSQVQIIGTTVDGSTVTIYMPKEVYLNSFKIRRITQTDIDNGNEFPLNTRVLSITLTNGQEFLVSIDEFDTDTKYLVADTNTIDLTLGADNVITAELIIDKGNNKTSPIHINTTESGIYSDITLSSEDTGIELYKENSAIAARIPIKGSDSYIFFEDMTLAKYMSLDSPSPGHIYLIRDKGYIFYNGQRYGVDIDSTDALITGISYDEASMTLTIEYSDERPVTNILLGPVSDSRPGMMTSQMLQTLNQTREDVDELQGMIGMPNGLATLDENGKIPVSQLNGHLARVQGVDAVVMSELPTESISIDYMVWMISTKKFNEWNGTEWIELDPAADTIYNFRNSDAEGNTDRTNILYRWDGQNLVEISESLALGEVEGTAYEGSKGKQNADNIASLQSQVGDTDFSSTTYLQDVENLTQAGIFLDQALKQVNDDLGELDGESIKGIQINGTDIPASQGVVNLPLASTTSDGTLSKEDKVKIDYITGEGDGSQFLSDDGTYKTIEMNLSDDYTASDKVNNDLQPIPGDSFQESISKLHKAILDDEEVIAQTFSNIQTVLGVENPNQVIPNLDNTNYLQGQSQIIEILKVLDFTLKSVHDSITNVNSTLEELKNALTLKEV